MPISVSSSLLQTDQHVARDVQEQNPPIVIEIGGHASSEGGEESRQVEITLAALRSADDRSGDRRERGDLTQDDDEQATSTSFTMPETCFSAGT
jgi:hypothetical protein